MTYARISSQLPPGSPGFLGGYLLEQVGHPATLALPLWKDGAGLEVVDDWSCPARTGPWRTGYCPQWTDDGQVQWPAAAAWATKSSNVAGGRPSARSTPSVRAAPEPSRMAASTAVSSRATSGETP